MALTKAQIQRLYDFVNNGSVVVEKRANNQDWLTIANETSQDYVTDWAVEETMAVVVGRTIAMPLMAFIEIMKPTPMGDGSLKKIEYQFSGVYTGKSILDRLAIPKPTSVPTPAPAPKAVTAPAKVALKAAPAPKAVAAPAKVAPKAQVPANSNLAREKNQTLLFLAKNPKPGTKQQPVTKASKSPVPAPKTKASPKPPAKPKQPKDITPQVNFVGKVIIKPVLKPVAKPLKKAGKKMKKKLRKMTGVKW